MPRRHTANVLAAIDVGTNAVRLELARRLSDGSLETLHQERDPVRPGEGVFKTGMVPREVADRLLSTLRRYGALCRVYHAQVRAVATSALRVAKNREDLVRRARKEAGLKLEIISGVEEARLICFGVLHGKPPSAKSICVDIGGGSTEVATALGDRPTALWSVDLGAVRVTELFDTSKKVSSKQLKLVRRFAREAVTEALPAKLKSVPKIALGSSGTINAVVSFAAQGAGHATARQISRAVEELSEMSPAQLRNRFDPKRAEIVLAGAVILESVVHHLRLDAVTAVQRGLRDGILVDLIRRQDERPDDSSLTDAAREVARRFKYDEAHSKQVTAFALELFDDLASVHKLPAAARPLLEVAAVLHDIGTSVSYNRHHKHSYYLINNLDIPGLQEREREVVARIARYHRGTDPDFKHRDMEGLSLPEARIVRGASTLLRLADSLDRSHRQIISGVHAHVSARSVTITVDTRQPVDLELWDAAHEGRLFRRVFGKKVIFEVRRSGSKRRGRLSAGYVVSLP